MPEHGRTLRQWSDLRLIATCDAGGRERYTVTQGARPPLGMFATAAAATAFFEAVRAAWAEGVVDEAEGLDAAAADEWAQRAERERLREAVAAGVTDLAAYRRRRTRPAGLGGARRGPTGGAGET